MSYLYHKQPAAYSVEIRLSPLSDTRTDTICYLADLRQALDTLSDNSYLIVDIRLLNFSFSELIQALEIASRSDDGKAVVAHPNIERTIALVNPSSLIPMGLKTLWQSQRNQGGKRIVTTYEEARLCIDNLEARKEDLFDLNYSEKSA